MKKQLILTLLVSFVVCLNGFAQAEEELPAQAAEQASLKEANSEKEMPEQAQKGKKAAEKEAKKAEKAAKMAEKEAKKAAKEAEEEEGGEE